jgi:membrane-bound serine protease (ClpP class)
MAPIVVIIALLACGMVLAVAEIAILPGFGVAGVGAMAMIGGGAVLAWVHYGPTWGVGSLLVAGVVTVGLLAWAPKTRAGRQLILADQMARPGSAERLVGKSGRAVTALRPAGVAELDGRRVDVVTEGVFVEAGREVRVVSVEGAKVVVAPVAPTAAQS